VDPSVVVLPGAQALVTQIISEGWAQARTWLSRRLGHADATLAADMERRLDAAQVQAAALTVPAAFPQRVILEAYWAGYLAALTGEDPEFAAAIAGLAPPLADHTPSPRNVNSVTGTVTGNLVQAHDIDGGVSFS
jgi:hypothetical protein